MAVSYTNFSQQYEQHGSEWSRAIENVLKSGQYILGTQVKLFEEAVRQHTGTKHAVAVANGTDALILALKVNGVGYGDEVITAPNSFIASAGAIAAVGAKPVFVDVREDYTIDPTLIKDSLSRKTKAIMPVHLTGRPADMQPIMDIARNYGLAVIEDAAQAIGADIQGKKVGSFGIGCFSLHPLKTLNALGDGGVISTDNTDVYNQIMRLRNHGLQDRDHASCWGYNSRLDEIQASILLTKLPYLEAWNKQRRETAEIYRKNLEDVVSVPRDVPGVTAVYHTFIIQCEGRDNLRSYLNQKDIETKIHYPVPLHLQPAAKHLGYQLGDFPVTERQASQILSLPIHSGIGPKEAHEVIGAIRSFYGK